MKFVLGAGVEMLIAALAPLAGAHPFPPEFDLANLLAANGGDGSAGFILSGLDRGDWLGFAVSGVGDLNADGYDDVVVGAPPASTADLGPTGQAYVVFGSDAGLPPELNVSDLFAANGGDGSRGFVVLGRSLAGQCGYAVSGAGDVNADGIDDLLVSARLARPDGVHDAGECYVIFGRATGFAPEFDPAALLGVNGGDGSDGFVLNGADDSDYTGYAVARAGDVNADGIDDLLIGAPLADDAPISAPGVTYVVFGRDTGFPPELELAELRPAGGGDGSAGFAILGVNASDFAGVSVSGAGDVNGDGVDDLIIGADNADPDGTPGLGAAYVVFGRRDAFDAEFRLASLLGANGGDGSDGFVLRGIDAYDKCGFAVSGAGDLNHDGYDDVVVGAPFAEPGASVAAGETYVVFGRGTPFPAEVPLPGLFPANGGDGSAGFVLTGEGNSYQGGYAVSNAGDLNADGFDDLAVSAPGAKVGDRFDAGRIFIVYGRATGFPAAIELATLAADPSAGFAINGRSTDDLAGNAVSNAGDVNADGVDDLVIGANHASNEYGYEAGEAYVVFGRRAACTPADIAAPYATLNLDDIAAFASAFVAADPLADLDANGVLDLDDITAFAQAFVAGCP